MVCAMYLTVCGSYRRPDCKPNPRTPPASKGNGTRTMLPATASRRLPDTCNEEVVVFFAPHGGVARRRFKNSLGGSLLRYARHPQRGLRWLNRRSRKCKHYYFYWDDGKFGLTQVRLSSYFPFDVHVVLNGRDWLARHSTPRTLATFKWYNPSSCDAR